MPSAKELIDTLTAGALAQPSKVEDIEASISIEVSGDQVRQWIFHCKKPFSVEAGTGNSDCQISLAAQDLEAILDGTLNPQAAFAEGRISIAGDHEQLLKLPLLFSLCKP